MNDPNVWFAELRTIAKRDYEAGALCYLANLNLADELRRNGATPAQAAVFMWRIVLAGEEN